MKVLITGHKGFVGQNLVRMLREQKQHSLRGMDIRDDTAEISMAGPDLAHDEIPLYALKNRPADIVIHLASSVSTPGSIDRPMETFRNTVRTAVNVMEACRITSTPLIITSSVKARDGMTPYGAAKRMVEIWAREYRAAYALPIVINRPGTIYGPGQEGSPESGWVAWFLKARQLQKKITIHGDGTQVRDLLHVWDYCRLLVQQMENMQAYDTGQIWDVGGGEHNAVSVRQMADYLGLDYLFGPARYGDVQEYIGLNDVPGWEPQIQWQHSETLEV